MGGITLFIFGGVAEMSREPPSAKSEFFVAIAGPIVSILIALVCLAATAFGSQAMPQSVAAVIGYLGLINAVVVAFNLIPAFPLDGGRVLRSILWHVKGDLRWATRIASSLGSAFGTALIILGLMSLLAGNVIGAVWQFLIGVFLRNAAQMSFQQVLVRRILEGEPVSRFMQSEPITVDPSLRVEELVEDYIYRFHHKLFPVTDNGKLVGCVTTRDVQKVPRDQWSTTAVAAIAGECDQAITTRSDADAMEALTKLIHSGASRMMVVDAGRLVGMLSLKDLMQFIALKVDLEDDESAAPSNLTSQPSGQRRESRIPEESASSAGCRLTR
jgi:CBS domain-containing protein